MDKDTSIISTIGGISLETTNDLVIAYIETVKGDVSLTTDNGAIIDSARNSSLNIVADGLHINGQGTIHQDRLSTDTAISSREEALDTKTNNLTINSTIKDAQNLFISLDNESLVVASNGEEWSLLLVNKSNTLDLEKANISTFFVYIGNIIENTVDINIESNINDDNTLHANQEIVEDLFNEAEASLTDLLSSTAISGSSNNNINDYFSRANNSIFDSPMQSLFKVESYSNFSNQLNFIYDFGLPLFDLYSSEEYDDSIIMNSNIEYWIEDIAI